MSAGFLHDAQDITEKAAKHQGRKLNFIKVNGNFASEFGITVISPQMTCIMLIFTCEV